ncbi:MAG: cytochrome b/b6 domain-containing protein [Halioglobus sp.]
MAQPVWDLPTRLFHWAIVLLCPAAWWTAENQRFDAHEWIGCTILVLVVARILWGFIGSRHSRFSDFLAGPKKVWAYVGALRAGQVPAQPGHNPLGGWSVLALLTLLLLQSVSGLFNADDILFSGPLYYAAPDELRGFMGEVHDWAFDLLLALVALHIAAVFYHQFRLREKLLQAMVKGSAEGREGQFTPVPWWRALVLAALLAGLLWWGLDQAPQPDPNRWF